MTTPRPTETTTLVHVHRRDWRPCPWTLRSPRKPRKPAAIWWFALAAAIQHDTTFVEFVHAWPGEFPRLAAES